MRKAAWQIDYQNRKITVSDSAEKLQVSPTATALTMESGKMKNVYFDVSIDGIPSKFAFDTGFNGNIQADSTFFNRLKAQNEALEYTVETGVLFSDINGIITGKTMNVRAEQVDIEGMVLSDQLMSLAGKNMSLLGNEFFEHYTLTIDWENDQLFFDPIKEFEADMLWGFEFRFAPNFETKRVEIIRFQQNHSLAEPITFDAEIIEINGVDVSHFSSEEFCAYWEEIGSHLQQQASLNMVIVDQGERKNITLTKKVLLPK